MEGRRSLPSRAARPSVGSLGPGSPKPSIRQAAPSSASKKQAAPASATKQKPANAKPADAEVPAYYAAPMYESPRAELLASRDAAAVTQFFVGMSGYLRIKPFSIREFEDALLNPTGAAAADQAQSSGAAAVSSTGAGATSSAAAASSSSSPSSLHPLLDICLSRLLIRDKQLRNKLNPDEGMGGDWVNRQLRDTIHMWYNRRHTLKQLMDVTIERSRAQLKVGMPRELCMEDSSKAVEEVLHLLEGDRSSAAAASSGKGGKQQLAGSKRKAGRSAADGNNEDADDDAIINGGGVLPRTGSLPQVPSDSAHSKFADTDGYDADDWEDNEELEARLARGEAYDAERHRAHRRARLAAAAAAQAAPLKSLGGGGVSESKGGDEDADAGDGSPSKRLRVADGAQAGGAPNSAEKAAMDYRSSIGDQQQEAAIGTPGASLFVGPIHPGTVTAKVAELMRLQTVNAQGEEIDEAEAAARAWRMLNGLPVDAAKDDVEEDDGDGDGSEDGENGDGSTGLPRIRKVKKSVSLADRFKEQLKAMEKLTDEDIADALCVHAKDHDEADEDDVAEAYEMDGLLEPLDEYTAAASKSGAAGTGGDGANAAAAGSAETPADAPHSNALKNSRAVADPLSHTRWADAPLSLRLKILQALIDSRVCTYEDDIHLELNSDKYVDNDSYASRLRMECLGSDKSGNSYLVFPQQLQHTASSSGSSRQEEPMIRVYKDGTTKYKSGRVVRSWTPIATDLQSLEALLAALGALPPPRWSPTDTESLHAVPKMVRTAAMEEGTNSGGADPQLIIALFGMLEQARMKIDRETLKKAVEIRKAKAQAAYDAIPRRKSGRLHAEPEGELLPGIGYTNSGNPSGGGDGGGSGASIMSSAASATGEDGTSRAQATSPVMDTMEDGLDGSNADNGNQQQQQQHDGGGGSAGTGAGNDDVAMDGDNGAAVAPSPSDAGEQQQLQQLATFTSTPAPNAMAVTASSAKSTDRPKRSALLVAEQKLASAAPIQRPKSDRAQLISSLEKMRHKEKVATIAILIADLPWWERFIGLHWNALPHAERYHTDVTKARLEEKKAWLVNEERERLRRIDKERQRREREAEQRLEQLEQVEAEAMKKEESTKELAGEREIRKQRREQGIAADWDPRIWGWPGASGLRLRIRLAGTHTEDVMAWFHESDNVVATIPADGSAEDAVPVPAAGVGAGSASSSAVPAGAQPPAAASKLLVIIDEFARYVRQLRSDGYSKADIKTGKDAARFEALGVTEPPAKQPKPAPKPRQSIGGAAAAALAGSAGAAVPAGLAGAATPSAAAASAEFTGTKSRPSRSSMETAELAEPQDPWIWTAEPADSDATDRSMSNAAAGIPAAHIIRDGEYQDPETGQSTTVASNIKIRISREERRIVEEREAAAAAAAAARAARIAAEAAAAREAARIAAGGEPFPSSSGASAGGGMMMGQSPSRRSPAHAHQAMPGVRSPQSNAAYLAMHSHAAAAQQYQYQHQHQQQVPYQQQQVFKQRSPARAPSGPFVAAAGSSMSAGGVPMEQPWRYAAPAQQHQQQAYHSQQHQLQQYEYNQHQQQYWQQGADAYGTAPFLNQGQQQQRQYRSAFDGIAAAAATSDQQVQHLQQRHYADAARADELMDDDETAGQGYDNEHDDQRVDGGGAGYGYEQQQQAQQQQQQQQYYAGYGGGAAQGAPAARASPPQQQQQQFQSHGAPSAGGPTGGSWGYSGSGLPSVAPANGAGSAAGPRPGISYPDSLLSEWDNLLKALRPNLENLPSGRANAERNGAWRSLCARHGIDPMLGHSTYGGGSGSDGSGAAGYIGGAAGGGAVAYTGTGGGNRPSPTHMSVPGRTMSVMISSPRMPSAQTAANAMLSIAPQGMVMGDLNNHGQQQY